MLRYFGTTTYELPDDLFTRVRGANLFVRLESYDFSTGEFQALAVCSWVYTGGGSGSYEVQISGKPMRPLVRPKAQKWWSSL